MAYRRRNKMNSGYTRSQKLVSALDHAYRHYLFNAPRMSKQHAKVTENRLDAIRAAMWKCYI